MVLKGEQECLEIEVLTSITSESGDYWEENWLYASVKGQFPGFIVNYDCNLRTDDLRRCNDEISNLLKGFVNNAHFTTLEEGIELYFQREPLGKISITGKFVATELTKCCLEFSFSADISVIDKFQFDLNNIIEKYPLIGVP